MAPIPRADLDGDNPSSDIGDSQDSPLRRQFSEPFRPQSTSTQISQSPEPLPQHVKCDWCGKLLELPDDESISEEDVLNDHINDAHPKTISFTGYDGADDTYDETGDLQDDDAIEEDEDIAAEPAKPEDDEPHDTEEITVVTNGEQGDSESIAKSTQITVNTSQHFTGKLDLIDWLSNPRTSYPEECRAREAKWRPKDAKARLQKYWNVHDVRLFSPTYEQEAAKCEATWDAAFHDLTKTRKHDASEPAHHPLPYKKARVDKGEFLEVQVEEIDKLVNMLHNPTKYSPEELYALTETAAFTMKTIQDEYLALDRLNLRALRHTRGDASYETKRHVLQGHKKKGGIPLANVNEDPLDFAEKKEAGLYGYKHQYFPANTPLLPIRTMQDPFVQGGFVPTPAQARKMIAKKKETGESNADGWAVLKKHGLDYVPRVWEPRREPVLPKVTRKRKAAEVELPKVDAEETQNETEEETDDDNHPAKRRTRGRGGKRLVGESIPFDSTPRRGTGPGRGRGRGRGRGAGRLAATRATFEINAAPQTSSRGRGRRGASTLATSVPPETSSFPIIEPRTESPVDTPTSGKKEALSAEAIEEARRVKIANSKNPKRTKAMLDHWDRFNREGRIRNPKRSKAQIEQDRTVDGDGTQELPKPLGRRKRSPSLVPLAGNLAPKGPGGLPSMVSVQAQQQMAPLPPMGVPHYGHGHGPVNPYAAAPVAPMAQLGQPMPAQYAPFPYLPYGMGSIPGPHDPRDPRH
ncbi:uncharacterized protein N7511_006694 [Penicillium nucicola]|uniref:uncharacterized protein n=1 Tax=Penicillium nucicola TaxID=1850975 RepID=UPI002544D8C8|nr:uncharacterized protein N7511_006694 [Penicillium nucicola]KAJ5758000.1 hypothetical protein N7511_006694 [Penicillium nucicola]